MHSKELLLKALNALLFNIAWLLCVFGGDKVAVIVALVLLVVHMVFIAPDIGELLLLVMLAALGIAVDSLWFTTGVLENANGSEMAPIWLCALWLCFATTCAHCFAFLHDRILLAAILGAVFGSISYVSGIRFSDVSFGVDFRMGVFLLASVWFVLFPGLLLVAKAFGRGEQQLA